MQRTNVKIDWVFLIYAFVTLFFGTSIMSFCGLIPTEDGLIARTHYQGIPFLIWAYLSNRKVRFLKEDKIFLFFSLLIVLLRIFLFRVGNLAQVVTMSIEPMMVLAILRSANIKTIKYLTYLMFLFFLVECGVALLEAVTRVVIFDYKDMWNDGIMLYELRSHSLHGHPLQNAFIVSTMMIAVMLSKLSLPMKYSLYFLGLMALFCFNTRSSIYLMGGVLGVGLWRDLFLNKNVSVTKKILMFFFVWACLAYLFVQIETFELGSRLATKMNKDDASSQARFLILKMLQDLTFVDLPFGTDGVQIEFLMKKNGLRFLENSLFIILYQFGILYLIYYIVLWAKKLFALCDSKYQFIMYMLVLAILINTNNSLCTNTPVIVFVIFSVYLMKYFNHKTYEAINNNTNLQR